MKLYNPNGATPTVPIYQQTLSSAGDPIGSIGGNNYAWFVNIDTDSSNDVLKVDNVKLINGVTGVVPLATSGTILLGNNVVAGPTATFNIGGTNPGAVTNGYDYLDVTQGTATLSGDLSVDFVNGFENDDFPLTVNSPSSRPTA